MFNVKWDDPSFALSKTTNLPTLKTVLSKVFTVPVEYIVVENEPWSSINSGTKVVCEVDHHKTQTFPIGLTITLMYSIKPDKATVLKHFSSLIQADLLIGVDEPFVDPRISWLVKPDGTVQRVLVDEDPDSQELKLRNAPTE